MLRWDGTRLDALLLDLDDTLLDNRAGLEAVWREVADFLSARIGDVAPDAIREQLRASSTWFWSDDARHRAGRLDLRASRRAVLVHVLEALGRPDPALAAETSELYCRLRDASHALFPGALAALARLRAVTPSLGLVTNGAAAAQREKIERFDLARFFDVIVVEGELGAGKPEPQVFAHAIETLGADRARSLMAGDDFECDVVGALGAGLHAVWIEPGGRAAPRPAPRPYRALPSFVALVASLGKGGRTDL